MALGAMFFHASSTRSHQSVKREQGLPEPAAVSTGEPAHVQHHRLHPHPNQAVPITDRRCWAGSTSRTQSHIVHKRCKVTYCRDYVKESLHPFMQSMRALYGPSLTTTVTETFTVKGTNLRLCRRGGIHQASVPLLGILESLCHHHTSSSSLAPPALPWCSDHNSWTGLQRARTVKALVDRCDQPDPSSDDLTHRPPADPATLAHAAPIGRSSTRRQPCISAA